MSQEQSLEQFSKREIGTYNPSQGYNASALEKSIREFEEHILINKRQAQNTVVSYLQNIREFAAYIASEKGGRLSNWGQINHSIAESYLAYCLNEGKAERSVNLRISSLRMFVDFLLLRREANNNPFYAVKPLKPSATQSPVLTIKDVNRLVNAPRCLWMEVLENHPPNSHNVLEFGEYKAARDEAIIRLMFFAGLKTGEVVKLCDKDFDYSSSLLNVSSARTSRTIFLLKNVVSAITKSIHLKTLLFSDSQALFVNKDGQPFGARSIERLVKEYAVYYGVRADITPQDLRKIEFIKVPDAISRIVNYSESQQGKPPVFNIDAITTEGITLYYIIELDGKLQEDCFYFVPMHNIACLHTMDYFG